MPHRPPSQCATPGCGNRTRRGHCDKHKRNRYTRQAPRREQRYYSTAAWRRKRLRVLQRDPYCKSEGCWWPSEEADHIVPREQGGSDSMDNLQGLCGMHHKQKTALEMAQRRRADAEAGV